VVKETKYQIDLDFVKKLRLLIYCVIK
jgi:hypothetical protein